MAYVLTLLPMIWPWLILIAAQITALSGRMCVALALLVLFISVSSVANLITPWAIAVIAIGLLGAATLPRLSGAMAIAGHTLLILWCFSFGAHLVPGFNNLLVLDQVHAGEKSAPFTMYLNLDKPMVFFAVLLAWPSMLFARQKTNATWLVIGLALLPLIFLAAVSIGALRPEAKLPPWWLVFAVSNLFLTCFAEEAFFRGYLQSLFSSKLGPIGGVVAASLLFGLAHFGGGPALVIFATVLGLGLGLAYAATGRLWVPIAMHFAFNFVHLAYFTYPVPA